MSIQNLVEQILKTRRMTRVDQQTFMSALLSKDSLSLEDQGHINQVFDCLRTGMIRVVD